MVVVACGRVATPTPSLMENTAVAPTSTPTRPAPTITRTLEPTLTSSPEPSPTATPIPLPTATSTPTPLEGVLFGIDSDRWGQDDEIWRLDLSTSEKSYLLRGDEDWVSWSARFSPNNKYVVYWVQTETVSEVWISSLMPWKPELLLTLPETHYAGITITWLAVDKYLLLEMFEDIGSFQVRSRVYLVNTLDHQIRYNSAGFVVSSHSRRAAETCGLLAISPVTNLLSVWCSVGEAQAEQYLVIELNGESSVSQEQPQRVIKEEFYGYDLLIWSADGAYVAYATGEVRDYLYYSPSNRYEPTRLLDQRTNFYSEIVFAPDNNHIAYTGKCIHYRCAIIMDISLGQIIWTGYELPDSQPLSLFWSPDSRYLGASFSEGSFIVDVHTQEIVMELPETGYSVVWVAN